MPLVLRSSLAMHILAGSASIYTATVLAEAMRDGLAKADLPQDVVQLVTNPIAHGR